MAKIGIRGRLLLTLSPVIVAVVGLGIFFAQDEIRKLSLKSAQEQALLLIRNESPAVFSTMDQAVADTRTLGGMVLAAQQSGKVDRAFMGDMLKTFLEKNLDYQGVWVVWEPQAFDGKDEEFKGHPYSAEDGSLAMYWYQGASGRVEVTGVNVRHETFYTIPKQKGALTLIEPYIDPAAQPPVLMTTVTLPLVSEGRVLGVFGIDIALDKLSQQVAQIHPYQTGFALLLTNEGTLVASRKKENVGKPLQTTAPAVYDALRDSLRSEQILATRVLFENTLWTLTSVPVSVLPGAPAWAFMVLMPEDAVLAESNSILRRFLFLALGGILLIAGVIVFTANMVGRPLSRLTNYAVAVAGGDYTVKLDQSGFKDELAILGSAIVSMVETLVKKLDESRENLEQARVKSDEAARATELARQAQQQAESARREGMLHAAGQLESVVQIVSSASQELSAQIVQSERGAGEQADRASDTATNMESMNHSVVQVARNAEVAAEAAARTRQKAEAGFAVVREVLQGISAVHESSLTLRTDMETLSGHAQAISQIMGVISDIADQTNLLALNAAIEAARAGEAGRGFAVVADEVRKLAEKTMTSTTQVGNAIKAIQTSTSQSSQQVSATVASIEVNTTMATRAGESLEEIVQMVGTAEKQIQDIATVSNTQSSASIKISESVEQMSAIAEDTVRAMRESSRAVADLATQAQVLSRLIDDMKRG